MPRSVIISQRAVDKFVGWSSIDEFEDLLAEYWGAKIISPTKRNSNIPAMEKMLKHLSAEYSFPEDLGHGETLLVCARSPGDLRVIESIPSIRKRFRTIVAYVVDAYFYQGYPKCTSKYDHIFVTTRDAKTFVDEKYGVDCSVLRQGFDCLRWSSTRADRPIDVIGFGRIPPSYHSAFIRHFHSDATDGLYLHSPIGNLRGEAIVAERAMLFKTLQRSKISLAFHLLVEPLPNRPVAMFVTNRWLESLATGCMVVGKRPTGEMAEEMLSWEDATLELDDRPDYALAEVTALIKDTSHLAKARDRNVKAMRQKHDWRYRIQSILKTVNFELPDELKRDISLLTADR